MWENKSRGCSRAMEAVLQGRRGAEAGRGTGRQGLHRRTRLEKWHAVSQAGGQGGGCRIQNLHWGRRGKKLAMRTLASHVVGSQPNQSKARVQGIKWCSGGIYRLQRCGVDGSMAAGPRASGRLSPAVRP